MTSTHSAAIIWAATAMAEIPVSYTHLDVYKRQKQARRAGVDCVSFVEQFAAHICHVHISDYTNDRDCAPVAENSPHVTDILRTLQKHGYSGGVVTELYRSMLQKDEDVFLSYRNLAESLCIN